MNRGKGRKTLPPVCRQLIRWADLPAEALQYLDRVSSASALPVLAGFGVRNRAQVTALALHVDGVVIGSALIEAIDRGEDPGAFLDELRAFEITA